MIPVELNASAALKPTREEEAMAVPPRNSTSEIVTCA